MYRGKVTNLFCIFLYDYALYMIFSRLILLTIGLSWLLVTTAVIGVLPDIA